MSMTRKKMPFVPQDFEVPPVLETDKFRLRMLAATDAEKDYEAVMESSDLLHRMFKTTWPRAGFTLTENLADLERHEGQFLRREAFAYTVVALDESRVLGCVYIKPVAGKPGEARVNMWVRQSEYDRGLDETLFAAVKGWLKTAWLFQKVHYPGRESA